VGLESRLRFFEIFNASPALLQVYRTKTFEGALEMSSVTSTWRERRAAARTRRALDRALTRTPSPAMRDELLTLANSAQFRTLPR
jgi:hypothetical protein